MKHAEQLWNGVTRPSDYALYDPDPTHSYTLLINTGVNFVMSSTQRFIDVMTSRRVQAVGDFIFRLNLSPVFQHLPESNRACLVGVW